MLSERVDLRVAFHHFDGTVYVNCKFVFKNTGPACNARIGFPDQGDADGADDTNPGPYTVLDHFRSWVDGRRVSTKLIAGPADLNPLSWHVKTVHFAAHQTRVIRDSYSQKLGGGTTSSPYRSLNVSSIWDVAYEMDTGASWLGKIGSAIVRVEMPFAVKKSRPFPGRGNPYEYKRWSWLGPRQVMYQGFSRAVSHGRALEFSKTNFKPSEDSDVHVYWPVPGGRDLDGYDNVHGRY